MTLSSVGGLHAAYAAGETTPSAVAAEHFIRIERLDPRLHAFVECDRVGALSAAAESDRRTQAPRALEGVPIGIKSNIAVKGLAHTAGLEARRHVIADRDAYVVTRLREAGAIVLGTLNMHEAALGATTDNPWFGRTLNPHGEGRTPGGSSGGSGTAVAAGLCVLALGTDTMGSIRIPAAYTGVYGLKPGQDEVEMDGLVALSPSLDAIGPLARSLDDLARSWEVLRSRPASAAPPPIAGLVLLDDLGGVRVEPAVLAGYERAMAATGLPRTSLTLPAKLRTIRHAGFLAAAHDLDTALRDTPAETLSGDLRALLDYARERRGEPSLISEVGVVLRSVLGADKVLMLPTTPQVAFRHGDVTPADQADLTALANLAGLPALSLPTGRDGDGMPTAVQLVGPRGGEDALITFARALDAELAGYAPPPDVQL